MAATKRSGEQILADSERIDPGLIYKALLACLGDAYEDMVQQGAERGIERDKIAPIFSNDVINSCAKLVALSVIQLGGNVRFFRSHIAPMFVEHVVEELNDAEREMQEKN